MNVYSTLEELNEYRESPAISQSFLKNILANKNKEFKETLPMLFGSYLDCLLTSPSLTEILYCVGLESRPSEMIKSIIDFLWEEVDGQIDPQMSDIINWQGRLVEIARGFNYQPRWGDEAIFNAIKKDGEVYWQELANAAGRKMITKKEHDEAELIRDLVSSSSITAKYFMPSSGIDKYFQLPLYWNYNDVSCKGLLDLLIVEHATKTIYYVDIKFTMIETIEQWFRVASDKKYNFQMAWYKEGIESHFENLIQQGYKVKMRWMVLSSNTTKFKPWIVPVTELMLQTGKFGFSYNKEIVVGKVVTSFEKHINGFEDAIEKYKFINENGLLDFDINWYQYNGIMPEVDSDKMFF